MESSSIELRRVAIDREEGYWHLSLRASNGVFAGGQDFYAYPENFLEFVGALQRFGATLRDKAVFKSGDEGTSEFLLLHALMYSPTGEAAIQVQFSNASGAPYRASCNFFIRCEVAAINELGRHLRSWLEDASQPFVWLP